MKEAGSCEALFASGFNLDEPQAVNLDLLKEDGSVQMIRRAETPADYFATFTFENDAFGANLAKAIEEAK